MSALPPPWPLKWMTVGCSSFMWPDRACQCSMASLDVSRRIDGQRRYTVAQRPS
jgi:hypothetical protein